MVESVGAKGDRQTFADALLAVMELTALLCLSGGVIMPEKNSKIFVIDTNVFIHKPDAILSFRDCEVVVPIWVLEELDKLKSFSDEKGRNARHAIRFLDSLSKQGPLNSGVKMENGSILKVLSSKAGDIPEDLAWSRIDNRILATASALQQDDKQVFFVSKDINARVKATSLGIKAVDYEKQKVNLSELYEGYRQISSGIDQIQLLNGTGSLEWPQKFTPNEFALLTHEQSGEETLGRYNAETRSLDLVEDPESETGTICGVSPLNQQQRMAFNLLLDPSISLVSLVGIAGTGKTLLAIAAGLFLAMEQKEFSRVLVSRPVIPMGKDIGYLPGAKTEKLSHWMQPLFDNLEFILSQYNHKSIKNVDYLLNNKLLEIEALTYIRGRSLPNQFIIIDEAQNLSPHEIKTVVSRAGEGTKVVLTGDPYQIDSPYLDSNSNGLTYLVEAFKGHKVYGHVTLSKSERSRLAELAAELL